MTRFFTEEEFKERAIKFYHDFMIQTSRKGSNINIHITHEPDSRTTLIYNSKNGKTGFSKKYHNDTFDIKIGIGVAWQRYCNDYFNPIFIKQIDNVRSISDGDYIICKPSQYKVKAREVYKVMDRFLAKSTITGDEILLLKVRNIRTNEEFIIHEFEKIYVIADDELKRINRFWKVE